MSKIIINIQNDGQLWTAVDRDDEIKCFSHSWNNNTVDFSISGLRITVNIELSHEEQQNLVSSLTKEASSFVPHWQTLTPNLHRTVQRIENEVWNTARLVDYCFRSSAKGVRLSPLKLPVRHISQSQAFPVMLWKFTDEEKERLATLLEGLSPEAQKRYLKNGILIPFPVSFDRRQIHLEDNEIEGIFRQVENTTEIPPYWSLYSIAWDNFAKNKSHDSAVLILVTSIETALKWCLTQHGDDISKFLIEKSQSPRLDQLYACVQKETPYVLPPHYKKWLLRMMEARNYIAHKPRQIGIDILEIARWFAVGEAILKSINGHENDDMVGKIIEPIGGKAVEKLPPDTRGVVLRREELYGTESLHVVLDSGETWRFGPDSYKESKQQNFPDFN